MQQFATLILIRHAHVECQNNGSAILCGTTDVPLSPHGLTQIEKLRRHLCAGKPVDAVYSSPLQRALLTAGAAPLHAMPGLRVVRSLQEIGCGTVEGLPLDEVKSRYPALWQQHLAQVDPEFRWPGGESYRRFRRRVIRAVRCIASRHPGGRVILFTHAGVISQILGFLQHQNPARWEILRPGNASITIVDWQGDGGVVRSFNDIRHLL